MLDDVAERRRQIASHYRRDLEQLPGIGFVESAAGSQSSYKDFSITIDPARFGMTRDSVRRAARRPRHRDADLLRSALSPADGLRAFP